MRNGWAVILMVSIAAAAAAEPDPFRVSGLPPSGAYLSTDGDAETLDHRDTPMLAELTGVVGQVEPRDIVALRRGLGERLNLDEAGPHSLIGVLHLFRGNDQTRLDLLDLGGSRRAVRVRSSESQTGANHIGTYQTADIWSIDPSVLDGLAVDWWRIGWTPDRTEPGARVALRGSPADLTLDPQTARRIFRATFLGTTREVADKTFHFRVPTSHDPPRPAGVVIWISPTDDGRPPPVFETALDALGLIAIGIDHAGNTRLTIDRLQLALDALETAERRVRIDPDRVYLAGFSGGGKIASMLAIAMPETFAGTVSIGGLSCYHGVPTGDGRTQWPPAIGRPTLPVFRELRKRRIAAIAGDLDFNRTEVERRVGLLEADGLTVRLFGPEGLAHVLPDASAFEKALRWIDEPRRTTIEAGDAEAAKLLAAIPPDAHATDPETRAALIGVIRAGPWSDAAWQAAERLGYDRAAFVNPAP